LNIKQAAECIIAGNIRAAARLMRNIDDNNPIAIEILKQIYRYTGQAWILGITGSPGVGKSSLTDAIISALRIKKKNVGVVAVDPTSPFSGGAILGDRIRMQRHATDNDVFIRSLATRGYFGGITASTWGIISVMDAMGKNEILVETVGVGQDEIDIVRMADTTIIIIVPGLGDDIQAIKAGILEAGDIFVVNKIDREGADRTANELETMINMRKNNTIKKKSWRPPVIMTCTYDGRGLNKLQNAINNHRQVLVANNKILLLERQQNRARLELLKLIETKSMKNLQKILQNGDGLEQLSKDIALHRRDPYTVCEEIMSNISSL